MNTIRDYYLWGKEVEKQMLELDKPDIPLEAELQVAMTRNKLSQVLPMIERLFILIPQLDAHYKRVFEVLFQEGYYERNDHDDVDDPEH